MRSILTLLLTVSLWGCVPGDDKSSTVERCNGLDDDGDGGVDEDYPDADGDGLADCLDEACALDVPLPGTVDVAEACIEPLEVVDETELLVEWCYAEEGVGSMSMPAVGDVTGDGAPEIAVSMVDGTLVLMAGATGEEIWTVGDISLFSGVAIADVNEDGVSEVLMLREDQTVVALSGEGEVIWESEPIGVSMTAQPTVAELDGDPTPEIVFWNKVLNGDDGSLVAELPTPTTGWTAPMVADLDQDGEPEILLGNYVSHADGDLVWAHDPTIGTAFYAPVDIDDDGEAEVFWAGDDTVEILSSDGDLLIDVDRELELEFTYASPPCVADFDGDGEQEIGLPVDGQVVVIELDGDLRWTAATEETGSAGCSAFDFDDDGAVELVLADHSTVRIFDGATGEVRYTSSMHQSGTAFEIPVIADVDLDGSAEVIAVSQSPSCPGVGVYGDPRGEWAGAGTAWGVHDFTSENVLDDGSVPADPEPSWVGNGLFRGRPSVGRSARIRAEAGDPVANLSVEDMSWCVSGCPSGTLTVAVQVANRGPAEVAAGVSLTLLAVAGDERYPVDTVALDAVPSGVALGGVTLSGPASAFGPEGFVVRVNDDEGAEVTECELDDNERASGEPVCDL